MTPVFETKDLVKEFRLTGQIVKALAGINLEIHAGEFVAIMGPSGSGKTTLLHLLGGLDSPTAGQVVVGGTPLAGLNDDGLTAVRRKQIGFVFQFFHLLPVLTARENVALPVTLAGLDSTLHKDRLDDLLRKVGLTDRQHHYPDQLSGGQQQRVAIARALMLDPVAILADEPTGALDVRTGREIMSLLRQVRDEQARTVVVVTHDVNVATYADRVIVLRDGMVASEIIVDRDRRVAAEAILGVLESLLETEGGDAVYA